MAGENIVLIGFMGSGKSSIGRLIASRLDYRFVDTDHIVVQNSGMDIPEIFRIHGEEYFRGQERLGLASLKNKTRLAIATGGGIVTRGENLPLLRDLGFVVWLTATEEMIFKRVSRNQKRPLLQTPNPRETIAKLLAERRPMYEAAAQLTIDTSGKTHAKIADELISEAESFFRSKV